MQIKELPAITVLAFSCRTTLAGLGQHVRVKAAELYQNALENKLEITGPIYWVYQGVDGNPKTIFQLDICLPVTKTNYSDKKFALKLLPAFTCASVVHRGPWENMYKTYGETITNILGNGHKLTGTSREVYINMDFENYENNITEIQIGIDEQISFFA